MRAQSRTGRKARATALVAAVVCVAAVGTGVALIPATAAAQDCTLTVTLLGGSVLTLQVPPGTPLSSISLPLGVASVSESCPPPATATTPSAPARPVKRSAPVRRTPAAPPRSVAAPKPQQPSSHRSGRTFHRSSSTSGGTSTGATGGLAAPTPGAKPGGLRGSGGVPSSSESDVFVFVAGRGAVGGPELLYQLVPDPAVLAADLSGGGDRVRRAVAGVGGD